MASVVELSKDFVRVAKRLAARAKKNGIVQPVVAIGRNRAEASDGYVVVSVPADHESPLAGFDPAALKATHGATVTRAGGVHQTEGGEDITEVHELRQAWPDFGPLRQLEGVPFTVEPQLLIDALDAFPKDGTRVRVYLPARPGTPVVILGPNGAEALLMPMQEAPK